MEITCMVKKILFQESKHKDCVSYMQTYYFGKEFLFASTFFCKNIVDNISKKPFTWFYKMHAVCWMEIDLSEVKTAV